MSAKIFDYQAEALRIANTFKQKAPPPEDYHDWPEGSYTKGFVKVISLQYHGLFIEQLFTLLNRREISLVIVTHVWRMSSTRMSLLHDFVGSLKPFWGAMLNKKMDRIIMNDELVASLSQDELSRLLNECVAEVGKSNGKPVVVLFNVSEIPYCLSALYFVRDLENLVISCNFLWCIISSSPLVHLYNGRSNEIDEKQYEQIGGHRDEIEEDTEFPGLPLHLWDRKGNLILGTELLTLGSTENCQIKLRPRTHTKMDLAHQLEFAFVPGIREVPLCMFFSFYPMQLKLSYIKNIAIPQYTDANDIFFEWPEIGLKMGLKNDFRIYRLYGWPEDDIKVFDLIASQTGATSTWHAIPVKSIVRFKIEAFEASAYFALHIRP